MTGKQIDQTLIALGTVTGAYDAVNGLDVRLNIVGDDEITRLAANAVNALNALRVRLADKGRV
jgi:hypothetical protein